MLRRFLRRHARFPALWFWLAATAAVYGLMWFHTLPKLHHASGGLPILDLRPTGYDLSEVQTLLLTLGNEGMDFYLQRQLPLDFLFLILYGISFTLLLGYFLRKLHYLDGPGFYVVLLPAFVALADLAENIGIRALLRTFPDFSAAFVERISLLSQIKSTASTVLILMMLGWFGLYLYQLLKRG